MEALRRMSLLFSLASAACSGPVLAPTDGDGPPLTPALRAINDDYVVSVKPLFLRSCAHCHGAGNALPWYHSVPLVRGMIDDDIARARRNIDMSHDFPFRGKGTQLEYLDDIGEVLDDGSMPPLRFRMMHPGAAFTADEKNTIRAWLAQSEKRLRTAAEPK